MRKIPTIVFAAAIIFITSSPRADGLPLRVEIPYGILRSDVSCPGATHVLLDPCSPHPREVFVVFPEAEKARRFEGRNVYLRGAIVEGACSLPLLRVSIVGVSTEKFECGSEARRAAR